MAGDCQCSFPQPGEWVKGKVIGSGAFGTVHLAMNKVTGALFVVKSAESGAGLQSLENEANILERLRSPFIVQCRGRELADERKISIFMEYMAGGSLSDVAEKFGGALDDEVIRLYTREILCGLKYLHENGVVHCDLKCKNVLLGSSGNVKLADFGCAKRLNVKELKKKGDFSRSSCSWQSIGGTPPWMAPEVLRNEGLDYASDIWSLGCTVIEMATGRPPCWGDEASNPAAVVLKIACSKETPRLPTKFSDQGLDFLTKCLERNPKNRWTAEQLLKHPFIVGTPDKNLRRECACSPASILDIELFEEESDSEESEMSPSDVESPVKSSNSSSCCRNPFSTRSHSVRNRAVRRKQEEIEFELEPLGAWITVRSG